MAESGRPVTPLGRRGEVSVTVVTDGKGRQRCRAKTRYRRMDGRTVQVQRDTPVDMLESECFNSSDPKEFGKRARRALEDAVEALAVEGAVGGGDTSKRAVIADLVDDYVRVQVFGPDSRYALRSRVDYVRVAEALRPALSGLRLNEATPGKLSRAISQVQERHKYQTARMALSLLRTVFDRAVLDDAVTTNHAKKVPQPKRSTPAGPTRSMTSSDLVEVFEAMRSSEALVAKRKDVKSPETRSVAQYVADLDLYEPLWVLAETGVRRSEVLGFTWDDFDDSGELGSLLVRHHVVRAPEVQGGPSRIIHEARTKTSATVRKVWLTPEATQMLKRRRMRLAGGQLAEVREALGWPAVIFPSPVTGNVRCPDAFAKSWRTVRAAIGFDGTVEGKPRANLHLFRSTVGTMTTRALGLPVAAGALGHGSVSTTERHYVEVAADPAVAAVMGAAMRGAGGMSPDVGVG